MVTSGLNGRRVSVWTTKTTLELEFQVTILTSTSTETTGISKDYLIGAVVIQDPI